MEECDLGRTSLEHSLDKPRQARPNLDNLKQQHVHRAPQAGRGLLGLDAGQ